MWSLLWTIHQPFWRRHAGRGHPGQQRVNPSSLRRNPCLAFIDLLQMQSLKPSISSTWSAADGRAEIKGSDILGRNPGDKILWGECNANRAQGHTHLLSLCPSLCVPRKMQSFTNHSSWQELGLSCKPREQNCMDMAAYPQPMLLSHLSCTHPLNTC